MKKRNIGFIQSSCVMLLLSVCSIKCSEHVPEVHVIEMKQMQFVPAELTIEKGDTVRFINRDLVAHNITEASKAAWSSSLLPTGKSWNFVADENWNYICTIHPTMKGKILVK
jgi:plastocyanin